MSEIWIAIAIAVAASSIVAALRGASEQHHVRKELRTKRVIDTSLPDGTEVRVASIKLPAGSEQRCLQFAIAHAVASGDRNGARYEEVLVQDGMMVSVSGLLMKDAVGAPPADEREFRDDPPPALHISGNAEHPIAIGDPVQD